MQFFIISKFWSTYLEHHITSMPVEEILVCLFYGDLVSVKCFQKILCLTLSYILTCSALFDVVWNI